MVVGVVGMMSGPEGEDGVWMSSRGGGDDGGVYAGQREEGWVGGHGGREQES